MTERVPRRRQVYCRTQFKGFHYWPDAPEDVRYLRDYHRHIFGVMVTVDVTHGDRDVEFHNLKQHVDNIIDAMPDGVKYLDDDMQRWSCERWAEEIGTVLLADGYDVYAVEVNEDGENGAVVKW